jgi:hypothetical protein
VAQADASWSGVIKAPGYIADITELADPLWKSFTTLESFDHITNQMLLMEKYELSFGIQPTENASPISLVTMNDSTDIYTNGLLERTIYRLIKMKAFEYTGLSITELLDLPTYKLQIVLRALTQVQSKEPDNAELKNYIKKLTNDKG